VCIYSKLPALAIRRRSKTSRGSALGARTGDATALVAGLLTPLAFSPFNLFALAILTTAVLFWLWRDGTARQAAWRGLLFGIGLFGVGVSWVYVSMHDFGNMPIPVAALATLTFILILASYSALLGFLQARFSRRDSVWHFVLVLPASWTLFEWLRGWFLSGFPWLNLGYSQSDTWLAGYAPVLGVYGVSLAVALSAGLAAVCVLQPKRLLFPASALALLWVGGLALATVEWADADGDPISVTLVQLNIPLNEKWSPLNREKILQRYRELSEGAPRSQLIVWPEAAIPATLHQVDPAYFEELRRFAHSRGTDFLMGVIERDDNRRDYYNSVIALGSASGVYRKQHLVPFGEYIPFEPLSRWLMSSFDVPMSELSPARTPQAPLTAAGRSIGVSVCYEDAFGEELIAALPQASLLVNVSEDAWFGDSLAPHQRLQMARVRALETARPMLRAANTGPSAGIDHHGRVLRRSPQFQQYLLSMEVQPMRGSTPYSSAGNLPVVFASFSLLLVGLWSSRYKRR
jgi:apolipoprotein N-acyltransferase